MLGTNARIAGIANITTGNGATAITHDNTLTVDVSAITDGSMMTIAGPGNTIITGLNGRNTIDLGTAHTAADTINLHAIATAGLDRVINFALATDVLGLGLLQAAGAHLGTTAQVGQVTSLGTGLPNTVNVFILNGTAVNAANSNALTALTFTGLGGASAGSGGTAGTALVIYGATQDADARVALAGINTAGSITSAFDLAVLVGVNVQAAFTNADFSGWF